MEGPFLRGRCKPGQDRAGQGRGVAYRKVGNWVSLGRDCEVKRVSTEGKGKREPCIVPFWFVMGLA